MESTYFLAFCIFFVPVQSQPPPDNRTCYQGNKVDADDCCLLPRFVAREINAKCDDQFKGLSRRPPIGAQQKEGLCVTQCLFVTIGAFKEGKLLLNETKQALVKTIGEDVNFGPLLNATVDGCYSNVTGNPNNLVKPVPATPGREGCSFLPQAFMNCIKSRLFVQCPKGNWTGTDGCDVLKRKLDSGCSYFSARMAGRA